MLSNQVWRPQTPCIKIFPKGYTTTLRRHSKFSSFHWLPEFLPPRSGSLSIYLRHAIILCVQISDATNSLANNGTKSHSYIFRFQRETGVLSVFQCTKKMKVNQNQEKLNWKFHSLSTNTMIKRTLNAMNYWIMKVTVIFMWILACTEVVLLTNRLNMDQFFQCTESKSN